ncbi:MAG: TlyA family RNA methyltransferase [Alphaproteobacteria bacterium]|nr:TlyA family RNA methyltransferase [Alphaproteobacteria bacterium]
MTNRKRLDQRMVELGLASSRSRAQDAIGQGHVQINGKPAIKASQPVTDGAKIALSDEANRYVSRAGVKLAAALAHFSPEVDGAVGLDVGASTGGFTQVLLEAGAAKVFALDVGHGQLHETIAGDARVINLEGLNARDLTAGDIGEPIDVIVSDVSFISLKLALPPALAMAKPGAWLFALIKPQFEAGKEAIGKGGIVRDPEVRTKVFEEICRWLDEDQGWSVAGLIASPITGSDGNVEFIVAARAP